MTKELSITKTGSWLGTENKPSLRLAEEIAAMITFFDLKNITELELPKSSWDVNKIQVVTKTRSLKKFIDPAYNLGWSIKFSMRDGNRLCRPDQVFTMLIFCPSNYPFDWPVLATLDQSDNKLGLGLGTDTHVLRHQTIAQTNYPIMCHRDHSSRDWLQGHDPARTTMQMHAISGIMWIRAYLNMKKNNCGFNQYY
ncbi:hypothetical protein HY045_01055 [Candidatus Woesebacteria bacterium]|nr:hypothetical protein [Candidatus Woesebacteria bacterium]